MNAKPTALLIGEVSNNFNQHLIQDHYECNYVKTAEEALRILSQQSFSVLISDYRLLDLKGNVFHDTLRSRGDHTPIVFLANQEDLIEVEKMKICCGGGHLLQPSSDSFILNVIKEASLRIHERDCV